jgi:hypothetical protein
MLDSIINYDMIAEMNDSEFYEDNEVEYEDDDIWYDDLDGDHESGLASAGWGTDEDYGYYGDDF